MFIYGFLAGIAFIFTIITIVGIFDSILEWIVEKIKYIFQREPISQKQKE